MQKKETTNGQRIEPDSVKKAPPKVEDTESQYNFSLAYPTRQTGESKQQQDIAEAVMRTDGSYRPSAKALSDTARMMKEVEGFSLSDYNGIIIHNNWVYCGCPTISSVDKEFNRCDCAIASQEFMKDKQNHHP